MALDDLRALVYEPLPKTIMVLDYDNGSSIKTDDEMKEFFTSSYGLKNPMDLQLYSRDRRNDILRSAKEFGATIRQLVRLTGLSFGVIRNV